MNKTGLVLAIVLLVGIIFGLGYGTYTGYEFLSVQWGSLTNEWRAILIVVAAILVACTLFLALSLQSFLRSYSLRGSGKVIAYNNFLNWYSDLKNSPGQVVASESFRQMANQMMLWGCQRVSKQAGILYEALQGEDLDHERVLEHADLLYVEIRRDVGLSGHSGDSAVV